MRMNLKDFLMIYKKRIIVLIVIMCFIIAGLMLGSHDWSNRYASVSGKLMDVQTTMNGNHTTGIIIFLSEGEVMINDYNVNMKSIHSLQNLSSMLKDNIGKNVYLSYLPDLKDHLFILEAYRIW